jgi:hypothetical protein
VKTACETIKMKKAVKIVEIVCLCAAAGFLLLAGCNGRECPPQIVGEMVFPIPAPAVKAKTVEDPNTTASRLGVPAEWLPPRDKEHSWFAIILHHSATDKGNMAYFDKEHRTRVDDLGGAWAGVGYDFVIGNGTLSGDGEVETTFRWKQQLVGAHCKTGDNWANTYGVGIVLVGDFDWSQPSARQVESLVKLVSYLQKRYDIPTEDIYGHGNTPGGHATDCPGKLFPMSTIMEKLSIVVIASDNAKLQDANSQY